MVVYIPGRHSRYSPLSLPTILSSLYALLHHREYGTNSASLQTTISGNRVRPADGVEGSIGRPRALKEAWNPEQAAMGNSTLPTICDKLNVMSTIHLRKLIATLVRENAQRDAIIDKLEERIGVLEDRLNEMKKQPNTNTDVVV